ncbi:MAG: acyl-CoA dehydrogenase, partial [Nocardioidaceae bacterium]
LETAARRLRRARKDGTDSSGPDAFEVFNDAQDHIVHAARAHTDRVVLEAFVAAIDGCDDAEVVQMLDTVCDLYALSVIEEDKAWFMEHNRLSTARAKAVTTTVNDLCRRLRPHALTLIDGFGIPESMLGAAILE